ncbi:MAG: DUF460 domain-containing protein [archaeon]|nr:MAG: DUF460 domain-containing protein [archaeon]
MKLPKVIVGVDPGTTAAVAVLNLRGKILAMESRKNFGRNEIIKFISSVGTPSLVATDKSLPPALVLKISSNFNALTFSPREDMKYREKIEITKDYETKDSHQRDALAAALAAYLENREALKKVERSVEGLNLWKYADEIKDMVLKGRCSNVAEAIEIALSVEKKPKKRRIERGKEATKGDLESIVNKLRGSLKEKERSMSILERYAGKLEERVKTLEQENEKLKKPRKKKAPKKKDYRLENLKSRLKKGKDDIGKIKSNLQTLKKIEETRKKGSVPVKVVEESDCESLKITEESLGLYRDILYFRKYSKPDRKFMENLKKKEIEMIMGDFPEKVREKIEGQGIMVLGKEDVEVKLEKGHGVISPESLKRIRKKSFIGWLKEYRKRA